jgi:hypothetical protein
MAKEGVIETTTQHYDESGKLKKTIKKSKASSKKSKSKKLVTKKKMTASEREELLIENFVGLQKAMTNLSIRFENLSSQIVKLLQVFEESAKSLLGGKKQDDQEMLRKINSLLDQNKTIAQGLVLMESKLRKRSESETPVPMMPGMMPSGFKPRPLPNS